MVKGIPIEMSGLEGPEEVVATGKPVQRIAKVIKMKIAAQEKGFSGERFSDVNPFDAGALEITDFPKEMKGCLELEEELDRYFQFLSKLNREELLAIVKYEVYNRVLLQQDLDFGLEKTDE